MRGKPEPPKPHGMEDDALDAARGGATGDAPGIGHPATGGTTAPKG